MSTLTLSINSHANPSAAFTGTRGTGPTWGYTASGGIFGWACGAYDSAESRYLDGTFDLSSLPDTAVISGLTLSLKMNKFDNNAMFTEVGFTKDGSTRAGDNKAASTSILDGVYQNFGGSSDLWNTNWTPALLKAGTFHPFIRIIGTTPEFISNIKCREMNLSVEYTTVVAPKLMGAMAIAGAFPSHRKR